MQVDLDEDKYINERVCQILGSGGTLLVDDVKGMNNVLEPQTYMKFSTIEDCCDKIKDILLYESDPCQQTIHPYQWMGKRGHDFALKRLTWDCWAKMILQR